MTTYFNHPPRSISDELHHIATILMTPGHGILITDESLYQLEKQLEVFGISRGEATRIQYRNMLFSTGEKMADYVSGVAVHPEVLDLTTSSGCALHCQLRRKNILVGVTVGRGLVPLMCTVGEFTTQGLDGLGGNCTEYKDSGCDFTMWRAQYNIGEFTPSYQAIIENGNTLAKYAAISQSKRMLAILEVDIIPSDDNDLDRAEKVAETVLMFIYKALYDHHVDLQGTLLKLPVLHSGPKCDKRYSPGQISKATLRMLRQVVPPAVGGIILQVDGKTEDKTLCQLNAFAVDPSPKPWPITFSFDGGSQSSICIAWGGHKKNIERAQNELLKILGAFSQAVLGKYAAGSMKSLADQCYCKKALRYFKTRPTPLPDDCVKYDEICRPPTAQSMAAKPEQHGQPTESPTEIEEEANYPPPAEDLITENRREQPDPPNEPPTEVKEEEAEANGPLSAEGLITEHTEE
ncbi:PREDICTED: fructose-bisphosphate aldolase-like [Rhagoletis zephyria]|uniref:fructose-bisphosphate aldolase-like n=1 Tax=Rhagoletis zephyria TaxID=28612 RepID=UPI0008115990|nr:PREDICTED: fructose-bisphosphate aldolase-like [Rhagoletis zephyria]